MSKILAIFVVISVILSLSTVEAKQFGANYRLEKVLILSRHNIRSPTNPERAQKLTPHTFFKWKSGAGELSLRGGLLETEFGQYFRQYLVDEGFMTENYEPADGEFRFLANSFQRTVATAQYFSSGMLPVANIKVEHRFKLGEWDKIFLMRLEFMNDKLKSAVERDLAAYCDKNLDKNLVLLEKVLDFKDSAYAKAIGKENLRDNEPKLAFDSQNAVKISNSMSEAIVAADALVLQHYEEPSEVKSSFGRKLSLKQWQQIGEIVNFYVGAIGTEAISTVLAHPLLEFMHSELTNERKFTFLCGHDTNICGIMGALGVEEYNLPDSIEKHAPIGCKLVIERWKGLDGENYGSLRLIYATPAQIRNLEPLTLENPPKIKDLRLKGLKTNADGLYLYSDIEKRFLEAVERYNLYAE